MPKKAIKKRGFRYCKNCRGKLKQRGKTAAGKQRWYCRICGQSLTKPRPDLSRGFVFESFLEWLLGKDSQDELRGSARTFRDQTSWCWLVPIPTVLTGEVHWAIVIDGIRAGGRVCLVARTKHYVIAWLWVERENSTNWSLLLRLLPAPHYVVCDGQKGMLKALAICWPATVVQRCRFHVWLNTRTKLTLRPTSLAGQELLALSRKLLHVRTRRQARRWKQALKYWHRKHASYVTERTVKDDPKPHTRSWSYTHARLRSSYYQLNKQAENLLRSSYRPDPELPSTTNYLEGGINSPIRTKLKLHRGMTNEHQMVLVNWYLYGRAEGRKAPRKCL